MVPFFYSWGPNQGFRLHIPARMTEESMAQETDSTVNRKIDQEFLRDLYINTPLWDINTGQTTVHAHRIPGKYRNLKWLATSLYLIFFFGPYLRWEGRQAVLFDIPARKYHIFSVTIWPQDIWMLALLLLTFFITLFVVTALAGRVFCGYICWQTVWTDIYTWVEEQFEGQPHQRRHLDAEPWTFRKFRVKFLKHSVWIVLSALTGIAFVAYFIDVFDLWRRYLTLQGPPVIWIAPVPFLVGSYIGVGYLREQFCFWLCPYARIQGVMTDQETILPTYDVQRGEPRAKIKEDHEDEEHHHGDCIMCNLCVAVCPTGVDIRKGQQEGCITCGMCIDACDTVMEKVGRPKGLVRYASLNEVFGVRKKPLYLRPRLIVYALILAAAWGGVFYGITHLSPVKLTVLHERQPLFVRLSDGSIQNKYTVKIANKTESPLDFELKLVGLEGAGLTVIPEKIAVASGEVGSAIVLVHARPESLENSSLPIYFSVQSRSGSGLGDRYRSMFVSPR